jgi:integrase
VSWYGHFRVGRRQLKKRIGPKREPGSRGGLTRAQAEARLRRLSDKSQQAPERPERLTVEEAGERLVRHLRSIGRKRSTVEGYESFLRVHLVPFFRELPLERVHAGHVEAFVAEKLDAGCAPKSIRNYLGLLHSIFELAERGGWGSGNLCKQVDQEVGDQADPDVRFLDDSELEALLRAVPDGGLGGDGPGLYLAAAVTGLRQGELLALRWRDVDWAAARVRVRQNYVRGEFGTPKSKRSTRSVPLADGLAGELERRFKRSPWQADDDLVFAHPDTGRPLERSRLLKRFKRNLARARVRDLRFHDLRHTFGTRVAAADVPLRTLQEWMGHRDIKTTLVYADYQPSEQEAVERAFGPAPSALASPAAQLLGASSPHHAPWNRSIGLRALARG